MIIKQQLLKQQIPSYQHSEGTCLCSICLCGKCRCKPKPQQTHYIQEIKSIYNRDYETRRTPIPKSRLPNQNYQGRQKALSLHSVYFDDFDKKPLIKLDDPCIHETTNTGGMGIPFNACNSYAIQYPGKSYIPPQILKPMNQIHLQPAKMEQHSTYQRGFRYSIPDRSNDINFSKIMNQRLHTNSKEKNIYLNSSYQEQFKGTTAKRVLKLPLQSAYLPFGFSNQGVDQFVTVNKQEYQQKQIYQCPAEQRLTEIGQKISEQNG